MAHGLSSLSSQALQHRLNSCSTQAWLPHGMWNLLRSGVKPMPPALAGGFLQVDSLPLSHQGNPVCVCSVAQSCPILYDSMDCSPSDSSVHGISQARILKWVAISSSRDLSYSCPDLIICFNHHRKKKILKLFSNI